MADLVIVTGGSFSGKTSLIRELAARGHEVLPESAFEVISELNRTHGIERQASVDVTMPWIKKSTVSRSEALAWCVRLVADHEADWIAELREATDAISAVRERGPSSG